MGKIVSNFFISLDGVVESPDKWHFPYFDEAMGLAVDDEDAAGLGERVAQVHVLAEAERAVEAVGVENHGERVGLIRLVDLDEALGKDVQGTAEPFAERGEPIGLGFELGLDLGQLLRDDGLAIAKRRDLAGQLIDLIGVPG